jgi:hypothetical protein
MKQVLIGILILAVIGASSCFRDFKQVRGAEPVRLPNADKRDRPPASAAPTEEIKIVNVEAGFLLLQTERNHGQTG